jgi:hypothetical protein
MSYVTGTTGQRPSPPTPMSRYTSVHPRRLPQPDQDTSTLLRLVNSLNRHVPSIRRLVESCFGTRHRLLVSEFCAIWWQSAHGWYGIFLFKLMEGMTRLLRMLWIRVRSHRRRLRRRRRLLVVDLGAVRESLLGPRLLEFVFSVSRVCRRWCNCFLISITVAHEWFTSECALCFVKVYPDTNFWTQWAFVDG